MYASNLSITKIFYLIPTASKPGSNLLSAQWRQQLDMDKNAEMVANRRRRLRQLIADKYAGRQAALVEKIGINQGELSGLLHQKSFGEKKARALEEQLGLPKGWLDGAENEAVVAEFARVYSMITDDGRLFLRNTIKAVAQSFAFAAAPGAPDRNE